MVILVRKGISRLGVLKFYSVLRVFSLDFNLVIPMSIVIILIMASASPPKAASTASVAASTSVVAGGTIVALAWLILASGV